MLGKNIVGKNNGKNKGKDKSKDKGKSKSKDKGKGEGNEEVECIQHEPIIQELTGELRQEKNWAEKFPQSRVLDQGNCGACWVLSTVGVMEYHLAEYTKVFQKYSDQEIIDCLKGPGNTKRGCSGGKTREAFHYIVKDGITPAQRYPNLIPLRVGTCKRRKELKEETKISGYRYLHSEKPDEEQLKKILALKGPVVASMVVTAKFQNFNGKKVFYDRNCTKGRAARHSVIIVGYGTDSNKRDYWLIKNSYGEGWGDDGYIKLARNRDNQCKIASRIYYPIIKEEEEEKKGKKEEKKKN